MTVNNSSAISFVALEMLQLHVRAGVLSNYCLKKNFVINASDTPGGFAFQSLVIVKERF